MKLGKWMFAPLLALVTTAGCGGGGSMDADMGNGADTEVPSDQAPQCAAASECDDGLFCNGVEQCVDSVCVPGQPLLCDDGIACTVDRCSEDTRACRSDAPDVDGDGHRDASCLDGSGAPLGDDCDDNDINRFPSNIEVCDEEHHDEDCDEQTFGRVDRDGDTFADARCCNATAAGGMNCGSDCNDVRPEIRPGATEACDRLDNDCDTMVDEMVALSGFVDADFDGIGGSIPMNSCGGVAGFSTQGGDCDDGDPSIFPGAPELCDNVNNDCDGDIDEVMDVADWYPDLDGDGFGDMNAAPISSCVIQPNASLRGTDCDDNAAAINPAAAELCDGLDNNCNGVADFEIGVNDFEDDDGDGIVDLACPVVGVDCDDEDPATGGGAAEACDGRDNDCDDRVDEDADSRQWFRDVDMDGYGSVVSGTMISCMPMPGFIAQAGDCDDMRPDRFPNAPELCNGSDDDCDGSADESPAANSCPVTNALSHRCLLGECLVQACPPGTYDCNDQAFDGCETTDDAMNCGECGQRCDGPGVQSASCNAGVCTITSCQFGREDCDGDWRNGCETDVMTNDGNCGGCAGMGGAFCGTATGGQTRCVNGTCQVVFCAANQADCNGMPNDGCEQDLQFSMEHCGACFRSCEADPGRHYLSGSCFEGVCTRQCEFGWGDCNNDPTDGCELPLDNDMQNCGACNKACVGGPNTQGATCSGGMCAAMCRPGFGECNGDPSDGCETDVQHDPMNCGACLGQGGQVCPAGGGGEPPACDMGVCTLVCPPGTGSCDMSATNGCETDTRNDANHCGACGNVCPNDLNGTGACEGSVCTLLCNLGTADCGPSAGCETFTDNDTSNCGGCAVSCGAGSSCTAGFCDRGLHLTMGHDVACMQRENGALVCWGNSDNSRLGYASPIPPIPVPGPPPPVLSNVGYAAVTLGQGHGCGMDFSGGAWCWGRNELGQLGFSGGDNPNPSFVSLPFPAVALAAGSTHTCALTTNAQVSCWGDDADGQLANSTVSMNSPFPALVETAPGTPLTNVVAIASGASASCAATESNGVYCWGNIPAFASTLATQVSGSAAWTDVEELVVGSTFACVRRSAFGGSVYCWGGNAYGEIATPLSAAVVSPARVTGVSSPRELYAGNDLLCVRTTSGVYCRGRNDGGQRLGTADTATTLERFAPVIASGSIVEFVRPGANAGSICGWTAERDVYCWGDNPFMFIDPMGSAIVSTPTRIQNLTRTAPN